MGETGLIVIEFLPNLRDEDGHEEGHLLRFKASLVLTSLHVS